MHFCFERFLCSQGLASLIGQWSSGARLGDWAQKDNKSGLVSKLRGLMIRHTKSQRIGGEVRATAISK